jgi:rare lipoprotein A (peptidoglycan hydrolase)
MRAKIFVILGTVLIGFAMLGVAPSANPTVVDRTSSFFRTEPSPKLNKQGKSNPTAQAKPLAVWVCTTSWYGEDFDGLRTATGETYDMYGETAAHPTLPLGSVVRIVNLRNHRSQVVRINDRGPYVEGRELDVSYQVARELGFDQGGLARVRLELLNVPPRPASDRPPRKSSEVHE